MAPWVRVLGAHHKERGRSPDARLRRMAGSAQWVAPVAQRAGDPRSIRTT